MTDQNLSDMPPISDEGLAETSRQLKNRRIALGLSIADVAASLKVKSRYIEALEDNQWESLAHLYLVGYVKSYAALLHVEDSHMVAALKNWQEKEHPYILVINDHGKEKERKEFITHTKAVPRASAALFALPLLLVAGYWAYAQFAKSAAPAAGIAREVAADAENDDAPEELPQNAKAASPAPQQAAGAAQNYIIHSGEYTAVKVYDNNNKLRDEMRLTPGEAYFLSLPQGGYVLSSGDAALVDVYTDDMAVRLGNISMLQGNKK